MVWGDKVTMRGSVDSALEQWVCPERSGRGDSSDILMVWYLRCKKTTDGLVSGNDRPLSRTL